MKIPEIKAPLLRRVVTVIGAALVALALMLLPPAGVGTAVADHPTPPLPLLDVSSSAAIDANGTNEVPDAGSFDALLDLAQEECWSVRKSSGCDHHRVSSSYPADPSWPGGNR
jgi:hypothetical protein